MSVAGTPDTVVAVVGPTGSGKSWLAEEVALRFGGEIVSADSMQVYRGMDIGTAKVLASSRRVPYHCVDLVDPGAPYSAALFQSDARAAIALIRSRGKLPVLCGGTGLYVRSALDEFEFPDGEQLDNPVRSKYESLACEMGAAALHELLQARDDASARLIHPNNVRRTIRALEMADEGISYAEQAEGFSERRSLYPVVFIAIEYPRAELYARIDRRVEHMIETGLVSEVEQLLESGFREAVTARQAIGYKELVPVIEGTRALSDAIEEIKRSTRRYAKRQLTWFRADPRIQWLPGSELSPEQLVDRACALIESNRTHP